MSLFDAFPRMDADQPPLQDQQMAREVAPKIGITPPQILAQEAASGRRGAAWRLMHWIMENDPRATEAVASLHDSRMARNLLEFIALGTWARKPFVVPRLLRTPYARTRLRTLFVPPAGIDPAYSEPVLLDGLQDGSPAVRETSMYILGLIGSKAAVPVLITSLHDPLPGIRAQATKALGRSGSPDAVPALLNALHSADEQQSSQIFMALVNLGYVAVPALLDASKSHSGWMRWHSIRALCAIHDRRAFPALVRALSDPDHSVAWMAAKGLAPFGRECVEPVLHMLTTTTMTPWLAETASYVLNYQVQCQADLRDYLDPLLQQMHQATFRGYTSLTAQRILEQLKGSKLPGR